MDSDQAVSLWTRMTVEPNTDPLAIDDGSADGEKWKAIMRPLTKAPGVKACYCGRKLNGSREYILMTAWQTYAELSSFQASSPGQTLFTALTTASSTPLETYVIDFDGRPFYAALEGYTNLTHVFFPPEASTSDKVQHLLGNTSKVGRGKSAIVGLPFRRHPSDGWVRSTPFSQTPKFEGQDAVVKLVLSFWSSAEAEAELKAEPGEPDPESPLTRLQKWERDAKDAGALGWREEHFDFQIVPQTFSDEL